jgi:hypothetical protein
MGLLWKKWSDEIFMREMFPLGGPSQVININLLPLLLSPLMVM